MYIKNMGWCNINQKDYKSRIIDRQIESYLSTFGTIGIEESKWGGGKTWNSSYHCNSEVYIENPNGNFRNRRLAETSLSIVLDGDNPRLIDEWQEVTSLWNAVRYRVDLTS